MRVNEDQADRRVLHLLAGTAAAFDQRLAEVDPEGTMRSNRSGPINILQLTY